MLRGGLRPARPAPRLDRQRHSATHRRSSGCAVGRDDHEAEDPHESLRRVGGRPPVALPAIVLHRVGRMPSLPDAPVEDDAPATRGLLTALEKRRKVGQGATDDDEVAGRGAQASFHSRDLDACGALPGRTMRPPAG